MTESSLLWQALTTGLPAFLLGAGGLKILDFILTHRKRDVDDASLIRQELRLEVDHFKARVDKLEVALNEWRERYYAMLASHASLKADLVTWQGLHEACERQYTTLQEKYERVHFEVGELRAMVSAFGGARPQGAS